MIIQRFTPLKAATKQVKRLISPLSIIVILAIIALTLRLLFLGERPFHHDESLDAWFSLRFLNGEYNGYDPVYHGPLRFYLTAAIFWLFGITDITATTSSSSWLHISFRPTTLEKAHRNRRNHRGDDTNLHQSNDGLFLALWKRGFAVSSTHSKFRNSFHRILNKS